MLTLLRTHLSLLLALLLLLLPMTQQAIVVVSPAHAEPLGESSLSVEDPPAPVRVQRFPLHERPMVRSVAPPLGKETVGPPRGTMASPRYSVPTHVLLCVWRE